MIVTKAGRYMRDTDNCRLGTGGCCGSVERYYDDETHERFAVKGLTRHATADEVVLDNECAALDRTQKLRVPRVIQFVDSGSCSGASFLVLELVNGVDLEEVVDAKSNFAGGAQEAEVLRMAVQLLETLFHLHLNAALCHLDLTPGNLMLAHRYNPYDTLRVIDLGFAKRFNPGTRRAQDVIDTSIRDVEPFGGTVNCASPEQLRAIHIQLEQRKHPDRLINGASSDMFSAGVVLYEQLTGVLPFLPLQHVGRSAPQSVPERLKARWEEIEAMLQAHNVWEKAVSDAAQAGTPVTHPLLDKVRECSADPDAAADFFQRILHPCYSSRLSVEAHTHTYVAATFRCMRAYQAAQQQGNAALDGEGTFYNGLDKFFDRHDKRASQTECRRESQVEEESESDGESGSKYESVLSESIYESMSDYEADSSCESDADCKSTAEPNAHEEEPLHVLPSSQSAPAAIADTHNSRVKPDVMHRGQAWPTSHHSNIPDSGENQVTGAVHYGEQQVAAGESPAEVQPRLDIIQQASVGSSSSNGQRTNGLGLSAMVSNGEGKDSNLKAVEKAPTVATSESPAVSSEGAMAAGGGASRGDRKGPSSGRRQALQKLRKVLAKKLRSGCRREAETDVNVPSHQQDKAMKSLRAAATTELILPDSSPAVAGESESGERHRPLQKLKGRAGRCLQMVMPACMKPPLVHSIPHSQAHVQPLTAVAGSIREQQLTADEAGGQRQGRSKLTCFFKRKTAASKQTLSQGSAGSLATLPVQEPSDFILAVRQSHNLAEQADVSCAITTPAGKPAPQVCANDAIQP